MTEPRDGQEPSSSPNLKADPPVAPAAAETEASIPESVEGEQGARIHVERADSAPPPAAPPAPKAAEDEVEEDEEEPSASTAKEVWKLALEDATLGSAARTVAVSGVVGFAVGAWVQLGLAGRAGNDLLARNQQALADREMTIKACLGAALIGVGVALYFIWASLRKREGIAHIERWAWFLSPLMLAPGIASVLHFKPWQNEHTRLLPIVLATGMLMEVLAYKALVSAPNLARAWWRDTVEQVPRVVRERGAFWVVLAASIGYAAFFAFYLLRWHYKLRTGNFDLSINNNLMFGGLHGHFLQSPVVFPQEPGKYLANHAKFGGYLFLPLYALYPRPETLLVLQSTLIGASALPLFGFARRHLSEWLAAVVALCYLAYYPMHGASFSEFQYVPIAGFFVLTVIWAAETKRWRWFAFFFLTGITMREDIPVGLALVGVFLLLSGHRPLPGLILAAVASTYFAILRFKVMDSAGDWWFPNMYKELWAEGEKGFRSVIKTLLSNPFFVLSKILVEKKIIYLMHLLVPLMFLPARRWYLWIAFVPGVVLTLLVTNYDPPITFSFHYVMHWTPYLFAAAVIALKAIGSESELGPERRRAAAAAMVFATGVLCYNYGAFPQRDNSFKGGFHKVDFDPPTEAEIKRYNNLMELASVIPKDASLAATEKIGPHFSSRVKMYTMRHGPQNAEWALASSRELKLSRTKPKLLEVLRNGSYGVVRRIDDLALLKRGHDTSQNEKMIRDWRLVDRPEPAPVPPPAHAEGDEKKAPEEDPPDPRGAAE